MGFKNSFHGKSRQTIYKRGVGPLTCLPPRPTIPPNHQSSDLELRRRRKTTVKSKDVFVAAVAAAVLVPLALFLHTFSPSPLPMPKPYAGPIPTATPPKGIGVFSLVAGVNHRVAAFGYRGGSLFRQRDFSMAGALVKHPKGDLL